MKPSATPRIHARGTHSRLDAVLDLVAFAARPTPLASFLDELPRRIATLFPADICSLYLLEGDDLVMRGNVGFSQRVLGEIRLAVGEGITGMAVECMRPISLDAASTHEAYRHFPGLGEEAFPVFLAVPVAGPHGPLGALVLQRAAGATFSPADVELAAALTAPIAAAAERAHLADAVRASRRSDGSARRVTLPGRAVIPGRTVGAVWALRRPSPRGNAGSALTAADARRAVDKAIARAANVLDLLVARGEHAGLDVGTLRAAQTILDDGRLRDGAITFSQQAKGGGLTRAFVRVATEAARNAEQSGDGFAQARAREIADVCEALAVLGEHRVEIPPAAVLVGDQITLFDLLVTSEARPAGIALSGRGDGPVTRTLVTLLGVPAVTEVRGLFNWTADGDVVLVDGDHGLLRVNPSRAEVAAVRAARS